MTGARYTPEERLDYEDSLKVYRDLKNVLDTAELKGMKKAFSRASSRVGSRASSRGVKKA